MLAGKQSGPPYNIAQVVSGRLKSGALPAPMSSLIVQHPWASLLAALLLGLLLEWVLELFFLRRRQFDLERRLNERERDYTELRHEHGRALTDLKNRLTELDATQKAKLLVENQVASRDRELAALRQQAASQAADLARQAEIAQRLEHAEAGERAAAARAEELAREVEARESVHAALEAALRNRDATVADRQNRIESLEAERRAVSEALARADAELGVLRPRAEEAAALDADLRAAREARAAAEAARNRQAEQVDPLAGEVRRLEAELEQARQQGDRGREELTDRAVAAESRVAGAEARVAGLEADLARARADWENTAAALDKSRAAEAGLRQRVMELEEQALAHPGLPFVVSPAATPAGPDPEIAERLAALEAELAAVSDSHARLEGELRASREETDALRGRLEAAARTPETGPDLESVLADLDAVSRERNDLAAQLAALRSAAPAAPARRSRARPKPAELPGLLEDPAPAATPAPVPRPPAAPDPTHLPTPDPAAEVAPVTEFLAACPQRLHAVSGIDPAAESRLYAAGIGSYWQLSRMSDAALAEALEVEGGPQEPLDFAGMKAEAARLARETRSEGRCWNQEPPDDLGRLEGLGPAGERRLYEAGVCTYEALARMTPAALAGICPGPGLEESDYARWIGQAARLAAAREA